MNFEFVLDSSAWLEYISDAESPVKEIVEGSLTGTSVIGVAEMADKFVRDGRPFEMVLRFIKSRSLVLPLTEGGALEAARIKNAIRPHCPKFGIADAIHLATARERKAKLVTFDADFMGLPDVVYLSRNQPPSSDTSLVS